MSTLEQLFEQGLAAVEANDFEQAQRIYEQCLELDPRCIATRMRYASVLIEQEKWQEALNIANEILLRQKVPALAYEMVGICYAKLEQYEDAEKAYRLSLQACPRADTWVLLFKVMLRADRPNEAINCLYEALKLDPDYDEAHYNLGCRYKLRDEYELAEKSICDGRLSLILHRQLPMQN